MIPSTVNQIEIAVFQLESMAQQVEKAVNRAVAALVSPDAFGAREVIDDDKIINSFEIDIDNTTYTILALTTRGLPPEQLRKIVTIQKVNPILERIGDHAVNIAESVVMLPAGKYKVDVFNIGEMAKKCSCVLHDALSGLFALNASLAEDVLLRDDEIDRRQKQLVEEIQSALLSQPPRLDFETGYTLFGIAKDLERIGDLSMNIAEETMYLAEGTVV